MTAGQIAQIITSILAPLVAAWVAFSLNKTENHRRTVRDLFYSLSRHVDEFQWAFYRLLSHARNMDTNTRFQLSASAEGANSMTDDSVDTTRAARLAISALTADQLMLDMLFKTELVDGLSGALDELISLADEFLPDQNGGRTPDYAAVKSLPIDDTAAKVNEEIRLLWINKIYPAAVGDD